MATKSRFAEGTEVMKSNKHGMTEKGIITRVITKSTGYVVVAWESGKKTNEMAFNLTDLEGNALKSKPAHREEIDTRTPAQRMADELMSAASTTIRNEQTYRMMSQCIGNFLMEIKKIGGFAAQVAMTVESTFCGFNVCSISAKQAWVLSNAAIENGIKF